MKAVSSVKAAVLVDAGQHLRLKLVSTNHKQVFSQEKGEPKLNGTEAGAADPFAYQYPSETGTTRQSQSAPLNQNPPSDSPWRQDLPCEPCRLSSGSFIM